jgi:hypothetical protein
MPTSLRDPQRPPPSKIGAFISIPKNASHTVRDILRLGKARDIDRTSSPVIDENHQRGEMLAARYDLRDVFVFCFSRNPYDRCVSWYEFHKPHHACYQMTFREWVAAGLPHHWKRQNLSDYETSGLSPLQQSTFIDRCRVDFVGRAENFQSDMAMVVRELNARAKAASLDYQVDLQDKKLNESSRSRDLAQYYDEQTRERVYELLQQDFSRFGYEP